MARVTQHIVPQHSEKPFWIVWHQPFLTGNLFKIENLVLMFDKLYFEKEFPKQLDHFKKTSKQEPKIVFVMSGNSHITLNEIEDLKEGWISFWIEESDYKKNGKPAVLMVSRYDQIRQILFYPKKGEQPAGFRGTK